MPLAVDRPAACTGACNEVSRIALPKVSPRAAADAGPSAARDRVMLPPSGRSPAEAALRAAPPPRTCGLLSQAPRGPTLRPLAAKADIAPLRLRDTGLELAAERNVVTRPLRATPLAVPPPATTKELFIPYVTQHRLPAINTALLTC